MYSHFKPLPQAWARPSDLYTLPTRAGTVAAAIRLFTHAGLYTALHTLSGASINEHRIHVACRRAIFGALKCKWSIRLLAARRWGQFSSFSGLLALGLLSFKAGGFFLPSLLSLHFIAGTRGSVSAILGVRSLGWAIRALL